MASKRYLKAKITRLKREIAEIDDHLYVQGKDKSHDDQAFMLERKRDDIVRSAVLQLHTAIEDLLNLLIVERVMAATWRNRRQRMRTVRGRALDSLLYGVRAIGFEAKLNLAVGHGVIAARTRGRLAKLNTLRNKCSHNWILKRPARRGRPPLLQYEGADLHRPKVVKALLAEFGPLYAWLFLRLAD
jgi:hypothetical protein